MTTEQTTIGLLLLVIMFKTALIIYLIRANTQLGGKLGEQASPELITALINAFLGMIAPRIQQLVTSTPATWDDALFTQISAILRSELARLLATSTIPVENVPATPVDTTTTVTFATTSNPPPVAPTGVIETVAVG